MRRMLYTGCGEVVQDDVNGIHHPCFGDLGRVFYKVLVILLFFDIVLIVKLQKPVYKMLPIIRWDPDHIPRNLLESDTELLQLLADRARLNAEWESTFPS
jgi:hypothetical protein